MWLAPLGLVPGTAVRRAMNRRAPADATPMTRAAQRWSAEKISLFGPLFVSTFAPAGTAVEEGWTYVDPSIPALGAATSSPSPAPTPVGGARVRLCRRGGPRQ